MQPATGEGASSQSTCRCAVWQKTYLIKFEAKSEEQVLLAKSIEAHLQPQLYMLLYIHLDDGGQTNEYPVCICTEVARFHGRKHICFEKRDLVIHLYLVLLKMRHLSVLTISMHGWPSGQRRQTQVLVDGCPRGFKSRFVHHFAIFCLLQTLSWRCATSTDGQVA